MSEIYLYALVGGALIGLGATLMLAFNGRVMGISGILSQALKAPEKSSLWRWSFLVGMILGGMVLNLTSPELFANTSGRSFFQILIAGLLVGFGTTLGSGCTSGHGVCGISRLSKRSILATVVFISFGALTVWFLKFGGWAL